MWQALSALGSALGGVGAIANFGLGINQKYMAKKNARGGMGS